MRVGLAGMRGNRSSGAMLHPKLGWCADSTWDRPIRRISQRLLLDILHPLLARSTSAADSSVSSDLSKGRPRLDPVLASGWGLQQTVSPCGNGPAKSCRPAPLADQPSVAIVDAITDTMENPSLAPETGPRDWEQRR